ncbi:MAG: NUDIX domain-containing protein, partial [Spirochaetales bacterium]|nr:NUDIX domain-containing protein [Spirochaetales bacterium]
MIYRIKKIFSRKRDILGRSKYLNSSVLIPIVKLNGEFNLLFQVRAKNIRQGSDICFPGGKFDNNLDKNYIDTAIRECYEEIGVESNKVKILGS